MTTILHYFICYIVEIYTYLMKAIHTKLNVEKQEFCIARIAAKGLRIPTPSIIHYDEESKIMQMSKINNCSVADFYGDADEQTPRYIYDQIRAIMTDLYEAGICYPDITGYNFIEDSNEKIWIIDFGHAYVKTPQQEDDPFVLQFMNGHNGWNPEFR